MTQELTIAIAASFTADPIRDGLRFWAQKLQLPFEVQFAGYNQIFQQLIDPTGVFGTNRSGLNVILVRPADWQRYKSGPTKGVLDPGTMAAHVDDFVASLDRAATQSSVPFMVLICPFSNPDPLSMMPGFMNAVEGQMALRLQKVPNVTVLTPEDISFTYPVENPYDPEMDRLGHVPYTREFFAALSTVVARRAFALAHAPYKVIALDCDNTLWTGVCAEEGPLGIKIDAGRTSFQEFILQRQRSGALITLCSKNEENDVWTVFDSHPAMRIKREHVVAARIDWNSKSQNLAALAQQLDLGLDSFIFLDDNPIECAGVRQTCPQVLTLQLPTDTSALDGFVANVWALDIQNATAEDRNRTEMYRQNIQREQVRNAAATLSEFLERLELNVDISATTRDELPRVAQLTQRTNQFNISGVKRTEAQIRSFLKEPNSGCLSVKVRDRFGDYGLVGCILHRANSDRLEVDTFLLSCRVLGRNVELRMLKHLAAIANERECEQIWITAVITGRNQPARDFFDHLGIGSREDRTCGYSYMLPVAQVLEMSDTRQVFGKEEEQAEEALKVSIDGVAAPSAVLQSIATELTNPKQIDLAIERFRVQASVLGKQPEVLPVATSPIEQKIASIWREVMGVSYVGTDDDFFALGGDSLIGTQIVSRLREEFELPLPLRAIFENPTVAGVAAFLVNALAEVDGASISAMLSEFETSHADQTGEI